MCKMASFLYRNSESCGVEVVTHDLMSHSDTQAATDKTESAGWYEGHYTPNGEIECRTQDGRDVVAEAEIARRWPTFAEFFNAHVGSQYSGWLYVSGCKNIPAKLPKCEFVRR